MIIWIECVAGIVTHTNWSMFGGKLSFPLKVKARVTRLHVSLPDKLPINVTVESLH